MSDRYLCFLPYFFLGPGGAPHLSNSRIATGKQLQKSFCLSGSAGAAVRLTVSLP